jgi:DGQHR domain-containing protein
VESNPITSLNDLLSEAKTTASIEIPGKLSRTFGATTLSTTLPIGKLFDIYEIDLEVQRSIVPRNLSKLMDYIMLYLDGEQAIYFPGLILSARGAGQYIEEKKVLALQHIEKLYVVDGQHRLAAFRRLAETFQSAMARAKDQREYGRVEELREKLGMLYNFPMSVMIYLDIDARQERQLFSDINKLPRKIGGNLALLREQRRFYHVLASRLAEEDPVIRGLGIDMFSERGKSPEYLFSYQLFVELLTSLFEGRLRTAARNNGYQFALHEVREYETFASHYFQLLTRYLPKPEENPPCWSENIQVALALFFHEESNKLRRMDRYSLEYAMKILPHIPWDRIYQDDEHVRMPRRSRIMKAFEFIRSFFKDQHVFLISTREVH